jgi:hypothetical protein
MGSMSPDPPTSKVSFRPTFVTHHHPRHERNNCCKVREVSGKYGKLFGLYILVFEWVSIISDDDDDDDNKPVYLANLSCGRPASSEA